MQIRTLSILIPAFNEAKTIHLILNKVAEVELINGIQKEVVIVNDCSTDATEQVVKDYIATHPDQQIKLFSQAKNMGKGAAISGLCKNVLGNT
jgi:glycosyltransferase involved in cell wall biosynthesis